MQTLMLARTLTLRSAVALNMLDMIGVGPFITLPLLLGAMGGPQAMLGWIFGALLAVCDGLVWAELGAAMPEAGGSYRFLRTMYPGRLGRFLAFLFAFQLLFSAPLSVASGSIGLSQYAGFLLPQLRSHTVHYGRLVVSPGTAVAMPFCGAGGRAAVPAAGKFADRVLHLVGHGDGDDRVGAGDGTDLWPLGECDFVPAGCVSPDAGVLYRAGLCDADCHL